MTAGDSIAISLRNVSKKYRLFGLPSERFKEALNPFGRKYHREFWALRDITFEVPKGTTLGIIGRNGSGKSTLLQLMCSVLTPTEGTVIVKGNISALLELGAGFNPEFTGRANAMFNGAMMGLSRAEMEELLPQIEEFADIGQFFDQPIRTYSSGMFVRLAFAAAISVNPDILIVDEALAVGDIKFQRKCYAKFDEFSAQNKTIVFVSHNMDSINRFCNASLLLDGGKIRLKGEPKEVTRFYSNIELGTTVDNDSASSKGNLLSEGFKAGRGASAGFALAGNWGARTLLLEKIQLFRQAGHFDELRYGNRSAEILDFGILDENGNSIAVLNLGGHYAFYSVIYFCEDLEDVRVGFHIITLKGAVIYGTHSRDRDVVIPAQKSGSLLEAQFNVRIPLAPGDYFASFGVTSEDGNTVYDRRLDALNFRVQTDRYDFKPESLLNLKAQVRVRDVTRLLGGPDILPGDR